MEANQNYLLNLLSNKNVTFYIPPYQRNYEWTEEECDVFFEDIQKTALKNLNDEQMEHFFSSFTYFESNHVFGQPSRLVLIDGQQRLTTTMLFLAAARDLITDVNKKNRINSYYLKNDAVEGEEEFKIKLKQVAEDSVIFKKIILQEPFSSDDKTSKVFKNYSFFKNKMSGFGDNKIFSFVEQGLNKFSIVTVQIDPSKPWENPQEIFESMNSMGKPLSFADLVRNYLLMGLDTAKQEEYYQKYWLYIEKRLLTNISDFIRDYMQAKTYKSFKRATDNNSKELYKQFREFSAARVNNIEPFFKELCDYSDCYAAILGLCNVGVPQIDEYLKLFRLLKVGTIRSTLLAILHKLQESKVSPIDTLDIIEPLFVHAIRRRCVGNDAAENKDYPILTNELLSIISEPNKKIETFKILKAKETKFRLIGDTEFKEIAINMDFYSNPDMCKFILALIEQKLTKSMPNLKDKTLQIEHIMPQTLTPKWRAVLGENADSKHAKLVHTIGNLTLIRHNQELSNKSFDEKKIIYKNNSGLQIAKTKIIENDIWGEEEIRRRGEYLVDYFLKNIAPIPDEINNASIKNTSSKRLNFREVGLIGEEIDYIPDPTKKFKIIGDSEVEYDGNAIKLSPLVAILKEAAGELNNSGKYSGYEWFSWEGFKLSELMRNENYENIVSKSKESRDSKITQKVDLPNIPENFNACLANDEYEVHVGQYLFSSLNRKGIVKSVVEEFSIFNVIFEESQAAVFNFPEAFENSKVIKIDKSRINK